LVLFGKAKQRGLGTAAFEWEASHSKRALVSPMSDCFKKGKGEREKAVPHGSVNCYILDLNLV
jgi:hypothetical protein